MRPDEFAAASIAILRSSVAWQTRIARRLGVEPRTVRRWYGEPDRYPIPQDKIDALTRMMGSIDRSAVFPRGEWLVGEDEAGRSVIYHMQMPRFVARAVVCGPDGLPDPDEGAADVISGMVYVIDGSDPAGDVVLCEVDWIDQPTPGEITQMLEAAADAWEAAEAW